MGRLGQQMPKPLWEKNLSAALLRDQLTSASWSHGRDDPKGHFMITTISSPLSIRTEDGMNTAEYAVGTVGACGFAGILYKLLTSDWGQTMLQSIFDKVLTVLPF
jgi:hypothetical protein